MEKQEKKTGKHKNPNSLANLVAGGKKKGSRTKITKDFVTKLSDYIEGDMGNFLAQIESLPTRDQVMVKMKLIDLIIPKSREVAHTHTQTQEVDFTVHVASNVLPAHNPTIELPVQEAEVIELKNEEDD